MVSAQVGERVQHGWQGIHRARHSARLPRYLASATLAVFFCLGVRSCFLTTPAPRAPQPTVAQADSPSRAFALQFARAYLTYDPLRPGDRLRALAPFVGGQLDPEAGLTPGRGRQSVLWAEIASDQRALAGGRLITVAAGLSGERLPLYLAVAVEHRRGEPIRLLGYPALVGAPAIAAPATPPQREPATDPALREVVDRVLRNFLSGAVADLRADLTGEAEVTLPTRVLRLEEVSELVWLGEQGSGAVLATAIATDAEGATYTLTYELGIADRDRPYVDFIEVVPTDT
jgi:Conjugative transposon protein TcpC